MAAISGGAGGGVKRKKPVMGPIKVGKSTIYGIKPNTSSKAKTAYKKPAAPKVVSRYGDSNRQASTGKMVAARTTTKKPAASGGGGGGGYGPAGGYSSASDYSAAFSGGGGGGGRGPSVNLPNYNSAGNRANATSAVAMELNPQINAIQRQLDALQKEYNRNKNDTSARGKRADSDLEILYSKLKAEQGRLQGIQDKAMAGTQRDVNNLYNQLKGSTSQVYKRAEAGTNEELARLGLGEASASSTKGINSDSDFLQGLIGNNQANAGANLASQKDAFNALMTQEQANAGAEGASKRAYSKINTNKMLDELMHAFTAGSTDLRGRKGDLESTRGERIRQMMESMNDKDYARAMERAQMQFQQQLARDQFGLERASFNASMAPPIVQPPSYKEQLETALLQQKLNQNAGATQQKTDFQKILDAMKKKGSLGGWGGGIR